MIPKILHYVWLGGNPKSKLFEKCFESWKKFLPDFEIKEWNESNFDFSQSPYAVQAYERKKYGFAADYIRAKVLHEQGGIYFDTDVEAVKPFEPLLEHDFVTSFENGSYIETAILGSTTAHPFMKMIIDFYEHNNFYENGKMDLTPNTPILTHFLKKYYGLKMKNFTQKLNSLSNPGSPSVTVFKNDYFCPLNYTTKKLKLTENTYAIHYFDASWFSGKLKAREKFLRGVYYFFTPALFNLFTLCYAKRVSRKISKKEKRLQK